MVIAGDRVLAMFRREESFVFERVGAAYDSPFQGNEILVVKRTALDSRQPRRLRAFGENKIGVRGRRAQPLVERLDGILVFLPIRLNDDGHTVSGKANPRGR